MVAEPWRTWGEGQALGREQARKGSQAVGSFPLSSRILGHRFYSLTETEVRSESSGSAQTSAQLRPKSEWRNGFGALPSHSPNYPRRGSRHTQGCKQPAAGAGHFLLFFVVFLEVRREKRPQESERCEVHPPSPAHGQFLAASGGLGFARLMCIFPGGGGRLGGGCFPGSMC